MNLPPGTVLVRGNAETHILLLLHKNLYGKKQADRVLNAHLHKGFINIGFTQSKVDECVYTKEDIVFIIYIDDGIIIAEKNSSIDDLIQSLKKNYQLTDEE